MGFGLKGEGLFLVLIPKLSMPIQKSKLLAGILILVFPGAVYFLTLAPTVTFIDSGELAIVCQTLGIAHPTGYPLYTFLGRVFTLLPLKSIMFRLNLFSLASICFTNLFLFLILLELSRILLGPKKEKLGIWGAVIGALSFSFTPSLWSQATSNEVYPLNILLQTLILYLALLWHRRIRTEKDAETGKLLFLFVFLCGLSLGNHMSVLLLFPGLTFLVLASEGKRIFASKKLWPLILVFLLGLTVYLYLPVRASQKPLFNWGDPASLTTFFRHVSGWQYRVWMFSESAGELWGNLSNFFSLLYGGFRIHLLIIGIVGASRLLKRNLKVFLFLVILLCSNLIYGINYSIADIEPYFLPSFLVFAIMVGSGVFWILSFFEESLFRGLRKSQYRNLLRNVCLVALIILPLIPLKMNYFKQDMSRNYLAYEWAKNILRSVKKDAIILTNVWDHYSPWLYLRYIEGLRPDVTFVSTRLAIRSWHFDYLRKAYPQIHKRSQKEIQLFKKQVEIFEKGLLLDNVEIESRYVNMFESILLKNYGRSPLYSDIVPQPDVRNIEKMMEEKFVKVPEGLVYRLEKEVKYYPYEFPRLNLRGIKDEDVYKSEKTKLKLSYYSIMVRNRMLYLSHFGKEWQAQQLARRYRDIL